tara:strand:+ start:528 stop:3521 length:2994 start_codon:yes stop_codon:yes gene_type:complete
MAKKVKIKGTNFNDNLVGTQLTSGSSILTLGNFSLTTSFDGPKVNKSYNLGSFSKPITLNTLGVTATENKEVLTNNLSVFLNVDTSNPVDFVQFGSLYERLRVAVEQILTKWPAGLYSQPNGGTPINVINASYDGITNQTTFDLPTGAIINNYDMTYTSGSTASEVFAVEKDYKNLVVYSYRYNLLLNGTEYEVVSLSGTPSLTTGNIGVTVKGDPFGGSATSSQNLHLKPKNQYVEEFFSKLDEFESELLYRDVTPIYTSTFKEALETEDGVTVFVDRTFTWPVTDGYNIDNNTPQYAEYFESLLRLAADYDDYKTDLVSRFFVTGSIEKYDTDDERVKKMLRIYGREFDQTKKFIDGLAFAHNVSYDKKNNIPDVLVKNLARMLGWDTLNTTSAEGLLQSFVSPTAAVYSGQSKGYSFAEMDIELWRRLILNTAYLFKGKGTRKVIEFMFRFIGAPDCLVDFNEHIYLADQKIDVSGFTNFVSMTTGLDVADVDLTQYPVDDNGYPNVLPDTQELYFQNNGGWYRETEVETGNNPHYGPYDEGQSYIDGMFRRFFSGDTVFRTVQNTIPDVNNISGLDVVVTNYEYNHYIGSTTSMWNKYDQIVNTFSADTTSLTPIAASIVTLIAQLHNQTILNSPTDLRLKDFYSTYAIPAYPSPVPSAPTYGYNLSPLIEDNKKAWVNSTSPTNRTYDLALRETNYNQTSGFIENDSRLVINTKETKLTYNAAKAIECDVYDYIKANACPISLTGMSQPYPSKLWFGADGGPDWSDVGMDVSKMTFVEFIGEIYRKYINAKNRKVIDDAHGGGYPTLRMIYQDYLDALTKCGKASNAYKYSQLISFVDVIQGYWIGLVEQVFPTTTIWDSGSLYRNTVFDRQKYVYRHGINDGSEFAKVERNINGKYKGTREPLTVTSSVTSGIKAHVTFIETLGCYGNSVLADRCINNYVQVAPLLRVAPNLLTVKEEEVENTNENKDQGVTGNPVDAKGQVIWSAKRRGG